MIHLLLAVVAFVVTLGILVALHEYAHLAAARAVGVRVLRYSLGFGPRLCGFTSHRSGIEYRIAAIPLGGYVKMLDGRESDAELPEADKPSAFNCVHPWRRIFILAAGPAANAVFAVVAYWIVFMLGSTGIWPVIGATEPGSIAAQAGLHAQDRIVAVADTPVVTWKAMRLQLMRANAAGGEVVLTVQRADAARVSIAVPLDGVASSKAAVAKAIGIKPYQPPSAPRIRQIKDGAPAAQAGLQPGDRVLAIDGQPLSSPRELIEATTARPGSVATLTVERDGRSYPVEVHLASVNADDGGLEGRLGAIVGPSKQVVEAMQVRVYHEPVEAVGAALARVWFITELTWHFIAGMVTGSVDVTSLGGPVAIGDAGVKMMALGLQAFVGFLGLVSLSLALLNILPIPALDGGQIVMAGIEWIIKRPLPMVVQQAAQGAGMAAIGLLMGLALYSDLVHLASDL